MIGQQKVSGAQLAGILSLSPQRIRQLTVEGVLSTEKGRRGYLYEVREAVQEYVDFRLEGMLSTPELSELQRQRSGKLSIETERAKFNLEVLKGKYLNAEAAVRVVAEQNTTVKNYILSLPERLCKAIAGQTDSDAIQELLQSGVEFALSALRNEFEQELEQCNEEVARLEKTPGRPNNRITNHENE
jgi:hypothetical protein